MVDNIEILSREPVGFVRQRRAFSPDTDVNRKFVPAGNNFG